MISDLGTFFSGLAAALAPLAGLILWFPFEASLSWVDQSLFYLRSIERAEKTAWGILGALAAYGVTLTRPGWLGSLCWCAGILLLLFLVPTVLMDVARFFADLLGAPLRKRFGPAPGWLLGLPLILAGAVVALAFGWECIHFLWYNGVTHRDLAPTSAAVFSAPIDLLVMTTGWLVAWAGYVMAGMPPLPKIPAPKWLVERRLLREYGLHGSAKCPKCRAPLRTDMARQCAICGADWHAGQDSN